MTALSDIVSSLKSVLLMQSDIEGLRREVGRLADDLAGLKDFSHVLDKRVVRIETMIEMNAARGSQPRIEGS